VMQRLYRLAVHLARRYPWEPPAAAWLVLTGESPWVPPLTARIAHPGDITNHGTITMTAAHWVPEKVVSNFYSEIKARLDSTPTTSRRRLALFRFVVERSSAINRWKPKGTPELGKLIEIHELGLETPPWRSLQAEWNSEYQPGHDWHYRDFRNLRRDFIQASKSLLGY
jgi:hypothetical protein